MKQTITCMFALAMVFGFFNIAQAEDEHQAKPRHKVVTGKFDRLIERAVGEKEYLGVVLTPMQGTGWATLLIDRAQEKELKLARALEKGQLVTVVYVTEQRNHWVIKMESLVGKPGADPCMQEKHATHEAHGDKADVATHEKTGHQPDCDGDKPHDKKGDSKCGSCAGHAQKDGSHHKAEHGDGKCGKMRELVHAMQKRIELLEARVRELEEALGKTEPRRYRAPR